MTPRLSAQRVTLIALGVDDLDRSAAFYEALGWQSAQELPGVKFYRLKGMMLGLTGKGALAQDQGRPGAALGTGAMALAQNHASPEDVDAAFAEAVSAGAIALKLPEKADWGGYSGYYADPDGHVWEVAHTPSGRSTPRDILRNRTAIEPGRLRRSSEASLAPPHCAP